MIYKNKIWSINLAGFLVFIIDRYVKHLLILKDLIYKNKNIAFGLAINETLLYALIGIILFFLIFLLVKSYQKKNIFFVLALTLITLGASSNLLDRILYGYIIDFINISYFSIFNLADVMIVVGAGLIVIKALKRGGSKI